MDKNEISFNALFKNGEFQIYESENLLEDFKKLNDTLETYVADDLIRSKLERAAHSCTLSAQHASFEQGFCFAVKLMKAILKI